MTEEGLDHSAQQGRDRHLRTIAGHDLYFDWEDFLWDPEDWDETIALALAREMRLIEQLYQGLFAIRGIELYGGSKMTPDRHLAVLSANLEFFNPADIGAILDGDFGIAVRVGLHCAPLVHETLGTGNRGAVRFSLGIFNTSADIDTTIAAMEQIAQ